MLGVLTLLNPVLAAGNKPFPPAIQQQLQLPKDKIDIGLAALSFAKECYPGLDIAASSKHIDVIAGKAR